MSLRRYALAALVVGAALAAATTSAQLAGVAQHVTQPRPFRHAAHMTIACGDCHETGARHGAQRVWTAADCAACHHDGRRDLPCARCHEAEAYEAPRLVPVTMTLSVWEQPRARALDFDHPRHAQLACGECHRPEAGVSLPPPPCATCHADHHRPEAMCSSCHIPQQIEMHGLQVHLTCAGSGCHAPAPDRQPPASRNLCLMCHVEQQDHEPGKVCHVCHLVADPLAPQ